MDESIGEVHRLVAPFLAGCESQIELNFVGAFRYFTHLMGFSTVTGGAEKDAPGAVPFAIYTQVKIDKYRVDFIVAYGDKQVVVECDGRDFHHSTRQQVDRDRERDAALGGLGYKVIRFPGRQLDSEPYFCAADVMMWLVKGEFLSK